ncbi:MAG: hypothetical protein KGL16_14720 [Acidobacteriota bacterium]|nr:hypothetical protein [Acidobacteriota bacterium]
MSDAEPRPASSGELTIEELEDWLRAGARWRVTDIASDGAEVQFCTCTGTPVELRRTADPAVVAYLRTAHAELDAD